MKVWLFRLILPAILLFALGVGRVSASEGTAMLSSNSSDSKCFVASVLVDEGTYKVVMTCRNLVVPFQSDTLFYHAWARRLSAANETQQQKGIVRLGKGPYLSLGDITGGKLLATVREPIDEVFVTAETLSSPNAPTLDEKIVDGFLAPIVFAGGSNAGSAISSSPTPTTSLARVTVSPSGRPTIAPTAGKSVIGTAFRVFLIVLVVIVVVAVVISIIQRRSASK